MKRHVAEPTTERELQHYLVDALKKNGFWVASTSRRSKNVVVGIPDILAYDLLTKRHWLIEVKGPKTAITEEQEKAVRLGAVVIVRTRAEADGIVRREA